MDPDRAHALLAFLVGGGIVVGVLWTARDTWARLAGGRSEVVTAVALGLTLLYAGVIVAIRRPDQSPAATVGIMAMTIVAGLEAALVWVLGGLSLGLRGAAVVAPVVLVLALIWLWEARGT